MAENPTLSAKNQKNVRGSTDVREPKISKPPIVQYEFEFGNKIYTTLLHEDATIREIVTKIARENNGWIAVYFDKKQNAWEITAVNINGHIEAKGDIDKVGESTFHGRGNLEMARFDAIKTAETSEGGLHFFAGKNGIPVSFKDGELVFPNADELRLGGTTRTISMRLVNYQVDDNTLSDVNRTFGGNLVITKNAWARMDHIQEAMKEISKEKIAQAHGGCRSEKLMLDDNSVLILDIEQGELRTTKEHSKAQTIIYSDSFTFFTALPIIPSAAVSNVHVDFRNGIDQNRIFDGHEGRGGYTQVTMFDGFDDRIVIKKPPEYFVSDSKPKYVAPELHIKKIPLQNPFDIDSDPSDSKPGFALPIVQTRNNKSFNSITSNSSAYLDRKSAQFGNSIVSNPNRQNPNRRIIFHHPLLSSPFVTINSPAKEQVPPRTCLPVLAARTLGKFKVVSSEPFETKLNDNVKKKKSVQSYPNKRKPKKRKSLQTNLLARKKKTLKGKKVKRSIDLRDKNKQKKKDKTKVKSKRSRSLKPKNVFPNKSKRKRSKSSTHKKSVPNVDINSTRSNKKPKTTKPNKSKSITNKQKTQVPRFKANKTHNSIALKKEKTKKRNNRSLQTQKSKKKKQIHSYFFNELVGIYQKKPLKTRAKKRKY